MEFTRRTFLKGAIGAAGVAGVGGLSTGTAAADGGHSGHDGHGGWPDGEGTTLDRTIVRGPAGAGGYAPLTYAEGEPYLVRGELAGLSMRKAAERRLRDRKVLASFAQLTDIHVMDVQSPLRFEYFDVYGGVRVRLHQRLPPAGAAQRPGQRRDGAAAAQGAPRPGHRQPAAVHRRHRRQHRQLPAQRAALVHRPAGRRARAPRLRRPHQVRGRHGRRDARGPVLPVLLAPGVGRRGPQLEVRVPHGARPARRRPQAVQGDRAGDALVHRVRQPRRPDPGQRAELATAGRDGGRQRQAHQPAEDRPRRWLGRAAGRSCRSCWPWTPRPSGRCSPRAACGWSPRTSVAGSSTGPPRCRSTSTPSGRRTATASRRRTWPPGRRTTPSTWARCAASCWTPWSAPVAPRARSTRPSSPGWRTSCRRRAASGSRRPARSRPGTGAATSTSCCSATTRSAP